jgi:hypothetical protein
MIVVAIRPIRSILYKDDIDLMIPSILTFFY